MREAALLFAMMAFSSSAAAQVTRVDATATVTRTFRPDVSGVPIVQTESGTTLAGKDAGQTFGSGSSFQSTSRLDPDAIYFKNANAAAGQLVTVDSYTVVDIGFRNNGLTTVRPIIESTILPAGMGLFVGPNCLNDVASCGPGSFMLQPRTFNFFDPSAPGRDEIAGASFEFFIRSGSTVLYDLKGSLEFALDPTTGLKSLFTDLDAASMALLGFNRTSPDGSAAEFGFEWDATPIAVLFPEDALLAPGAESSITYETRVVSYAFATCSELLTGVCLNSYSAFGDPIGIGSRNPAIEAATLRSALLFDERADRLSFDEFRFAFPTFENGTLAYNPISMTPAVPEPATWLMLTVGFGMVGIALRRRRTALA